MVKTHKDDVREKAYKEPSEILLKEIIKGNIKSKRPIKVIHGGKTKKPHELLQALRGQYLLGKAGAALSKKLEDIVLDRRDMYSVCQLGYDGVLKNSKNAQDKFDILMAQKKPTLRKYEDLMSPLGNMIIGYKVLKHNCVDKGLLETNRLEKAKKGYDSLKKHIETIDVAMVDVPKLYQHELSSIKRKHGVIPMARKNQSPIRYNIEGKAMKYVDLFDIDELIADYEYKNRGKHAVWRGAKTKAFIDWLDKY
ncbi:MAG: hypothetical protein GY870_12465 [archaeon]|nr:hypothetical protein [archaeon]